MWTNEEFFSGVDIYPSASDQLTKGNLPSTVMPEDESLRQYDQSVIEAESLMRDGGALGQIQAGAEIGLGGIAATAARIPGVSDLMSIGMQDGLSVDGDTINRRYAQIDAAMQAAPGSGEWSNAIRGASSSVTQLLWGTAAIATGAAAGALAFGGSAAAAGSAAVASPVAIPAFFGVTSTSDAVTRGRDAGLSGGALAGYATAQGLTEFALTLAMGKAANYVGGKLGLGKGLGGFEAIPAQLAGDVVEGATKEATKAGVGKAFARGLTSLVGEEVEEISVSIAQSAIDHIAGVEELTYDGLKETVSDTFWTTMLTMGGGKATFAGLKNSYKLADDTVDKFIRQPSRRNESLLGELKDYTTEANRPGREDLARSLEMDKLRIEAKEFVYQDGGVSADVIASMGQGGRFTSKEYERITGKQPLYAGQEQLFADLVTQEYIKQQESIKLAQSQAEGQQQQPTQSPQPASDQPAAPTGPEPVAPTSSPASAGFDGNSDTATSTGLPTEFDTRVSAKADEVVAVLRENGGIRNDEDEVIVRSFFEGVEDDEGLKNAAEDALYSFDPANRQQDDEFYGNSLEEQPRKKRFKKPSQNTQELRQNPEKRKGQSDESGGVIPEPTEEGRDQFTPFTQGEYRQEGDAPKTPIHHEGVIKHIEDKFKVRIRPGRVPSPKAAGTFDTRTHAIRLKKQMAGDLGIPYHEVMHFVDKVTGLTRAIPGYLQNDIRKLDYDQNALRDFEGVAEWSRIWLSGKRNELSGDRLSAFDAFTKWITEEWSQSNKEQYDNLVGLQKLAKQYRDQGQESRLRASIRTKEEGAPDVAGETVTERTVRTWKDRAEDFYIEWMDQNYIFKKADKLAKKMGVGGFAAGVYEFTSVLSGTANHHALRATGTGDNAGVFDLDTGERLSRGLGDIVDSISETDGKPPSQAEVEDFEMFLVSRQAMEIFEKRPKANPGVRKADAEGHLARVRADASKWQRFETAAKEVTEWNNSLIDMLRRVGAITEKDYKQAKAFWDNYIPMYRIKEGKGFKKPGRGRVLHNRLGGSSSIMAPLDAMVTKATNHYAAAIKQRIDNQMMEQWDPYLRQDSDKIAAQGMAEYFQLVKPDLKVERSRVRDTFDQMVEAGVVAEDDARLWRAADKIKRGEFDNLTKGQKEALTAWAGTEPLNKEEDNFDDWLYDVVSAVTSGYDNGSIPDLDTVIKVFKPNLKESPQENIVTMSRDGKIRLYEMHPKMYEAYRGMTPEEVTPFTQALSAWTSLQKIGATGLSTKFAVRNAIRDAITLPFYSKHLSFKESITEPWVNLALYFRHTYGDKIGADVSDAEIALWEENAGKLATWAGSGEKFTGRVARSLRKDKGIRDTGSFVMDKIESAKEIIGISEVGPRLAEFKGALRSKGWTYNRETGKFTGPDGETAERPPMDVVVYASHAAADLMNFRQVGRTGKKFNRYSAYFNASILGPAKMIRTIKEIGQGEGDNIKENRVRVGIAFATYVAAQSVYMGLVADDDDYQERPAWEKANYWKVGDAVSIPKPHNIRTLFNVVEASFHYMNKGDRDAFIESLIQERNDNLPNFPMPGLIREALDQKSGVDSFTGQPIDPVHTQGMSPSKRFSPRTKEFSKMIQKVTSVLPWMGNVSPAQIDHALNAATGGAYNRWGDSYGRISRGEAEGKDIPFVGALAPGRDHPKSVSEFYEARNQARMEYADLKDDPELPLDVAVKKKMFDEISTLISEMRKPAREMESLDDREPYDRLRVGAARFALDKESIPDRYPNPLTAGDLPEDVRKVRDEWLERKAYELTSPEPKDPQDAIKHRAAIEFNTRLFRQIGYDKDGIKRLLQSYSRRTNRRVRKIPKTF